LPHDAVCPDCKHPVTETLDLVPGRLLPLDQPFTLDWDAPCLQCGYNLRTLRTDRQCPECGQPIRTSVGGDRLLFADAIWLRRVRTGITLWLAAGVFTALLIPFGVYIVVRRDEAALIPFVLLQTLLIPGPVAAGCFLTAVAEHRPCALRRNRGLRLTLRVSGTGLACMCFAQAVVPLSSGSIAAAFVIAFFADCLTLVTIIPAAYYLRCIALRIPNLALADSTRATARGMIASVGLVGLALLTAPVLLGGVVGILLLSILIQFTCGLAFIFDLATYRGGLGNAIAQQPGARRLSFQPSAEDPEEQRGADQRSHHADGQLGG
jgi:hypothetical protein